MPDFVYAVRLMLRRDLPEVLKIEDETFGDWVKEDFEQVIRNKTVVALVCTLTQAGHGEGVVGYVIIELNQYAAIVLNLAATGPEAREKLIDKAYQRATRHSLNLTWEK